MAIIHTQRNRVYACDRQPDDVLLSVGWKAPGDGQHLRAFTLPYRPVGEYEAWVDWAVSMADMMVHPIYVVPLNHDDIFNTERWEPFRAFIANMNVQEWGELRQIIISTCAEVMRDCADHAVRSIAYDQLVKLKVVNP